MSDGFKTLIPQPFWKRIQRYGLPGKWFSVWMAFSIFAAALLLHIEAIPWLERVLLTLASAGGSLSLVAWATRADPDWDTVRVEQWRNHYGDYE